MATRGRHISISSNSVLTPTRQLSVTLHIHSWAQWLCQPQFYLIALVYTLTRIYANVAMAYFPFYIEQVQHMDKIYVSLLPMVIFLASFVVSNATSFACVNRRLSRKVFFLLGAVAGLGACAAMYFVRVFPPHGMLLLATTLGVANSLCSVASVSLVADLIHDNTVCDSWLVSLLQETGAFVYGAMSLADKVANGVMYQVIEAINDMLHCR